MTVLSPRYVILVLAVLTLSACETPTKPAASVADTIAKQQRVDRAQQNLQSATKSYDSGAFDDALRGYLTALDSGVLSTAEQIDARKHLAFIHCANKRDALCMEQFENVLALDSAFELSPAEAGHPSWGPVFKQVKVELVAKLTGKPIVPAPKPTPAPPPQLASASPPPPPAPPTPRPPSLADTQLASGMNAYDAGEYPKALKALQDALKEPSTLSVSDQINARKVSAFIYCLTNRANLCRMEFDRLLMQQPDFDLAPAEAGHPSWGPTFRAAKAQLKKTPR